MKILIASPIDPTAEAALHAEHDVVNAVGVPAAVLKQLVADREVIIFRSGVTIDADVLSQARRLKLLVRAGCGLDNLDLDYARQRGLEVVRISGPGARAVAELAFAFMLMLQRQVLCADRLLREGRWMKDALKGRLLEGKTLGVYGLGNIGSTVARLATAWNMHVLGCVAHPTPARAERLKEQHVRLVSAEDVLALSDIVSLHVPLTPSTRGLIGAEALALMKRGALLVNLARGGVVDENALYAALESGRLAGAATDVHAREGDGAVSPLAELPNVVLTPHIGASTVDTQEQIGREILEAVGSRGRMCA